MLCLRLTEVLLTHSDALKRLEAEERAHLDRLEALALDALEITVEVA